MSMKEFLTKKIEECKIRLDVGRARVRKKEENGEDLRNSHENIAWIEGKITAYETVLKELNGGVN